MTIVSKNTKSSEFIIIFAFMQGIFGLGYLDKLGNIPEWIMTSLFGLVMAYTGVRQLSKYKNGVEANGNAEGGVK